VSVLPIKITSFHHLYALLILGISITRKIFWGLILTGGRGRIFSSVCVGFDLILEIQVYHCLGLGMMSGLDLAFYCPRLAVCLEWPLIYMVATITL
jgi:hypothetical protein